MTEQSPCAGYEAGQRYHDMTCRACFTPAELRRNEIATGVYVLQLQGKLPSQDEPQGDGTLDG